MKDDHFYRSLTPEEVNMQKEITYLRHKLQLVADFAKVKAGHKLMQVAGPFRELLNLLK